METDRLIVKTASTEYPIIFRRNFDGLAYAFSQAGLRKVGKVCIVSDENVAPLYANGVKKALKNTSGCVVDVIISPGEANKNLETVSAIYKRFLGFTLDRSSVIVALGGGVVGDMAGFAAATYMRGLPFIQVPTTLLAQTDSSVGGKTGVDFEGVKNLVGAFYQPCCVYCNIGTLNTQDGREFASGMGEVVKHALLGDTSLYTFLLKNASDIREMDTNALTWIVAESCRIKAEVVAADEKESGLRETLNLGHTFGHAIESLSGYTLRHGECVSVGVCAALYLSEKLGHIKGSLAGEAVKLMRGFGLPTTVPGINPEAIYRHMRTDKKVRDDSLRFVLLRGIGKAFVAEGVPTVAIMEALEKVCG